LERRQIHSFSPAGCLATTLFFWYQDPNDWGLPPFFLQNVSARNYQ
jgi:hypothetical protein